MLCDVAWARNHGMSSFILPESIAKGDRPKPETPMGQRIDKVMPGLPKHVLDMMDQGEREGTCGRCVEFDKGRCTIRMLNVAANDVSCPLYDPLPRP
jgi:hypothetical protein